MMIKFYNFKFLVEMIIVIILAVTIWLFTRYYYREHKPRELKSEYLKTPTNNALVILGLLLPILIGLVSYLYMKNPEATYSSLLSTIVLFFIVLIIALWETFAILKIASKEDTLTLKIPEDRRFITGMGLIYGFLLLGLGYFAIFFLFEIDVPGKPKPDQIGDAFYLLEKPKLRVNQHEDEVLRMWGTPSQYFYSPEHKLIYSVKDSVVELYFDNKQKLEKIVEFKKKGDNPGRLNIEGRRFIENIKKSIQADEDPEDIVMMINILSEERAKANNRVVNDEDYHFSAGILCILTDPLKKPEGRVKIIAFRKNFRGICRQPELQEKFRKSMTMDLLKAKSIQKAFDLKINELFEPQT